MKTNGVAKRVISRGKRGVLRRRRTPWQT